ncbi:MAG: DUF447 family protein [Methylotenera sp.]|nr:DUF447 family protein [Methylotenera sp.]
MIFETIITTLDDQGNIHTTPFGIRKEDGCVIVSPYKPSTTLQNILISKHAVLNLTDDVRIFAGALTGRQSWNLIPTKKIVGFRLENCLSHQELKLLKVEDDDVRPKLYLELIHEEQHQPFAGFNRAQAAVIELAVLVSRLRRLPMEKITQDIEYLKIAIDKTAGPRELEAWEWLIESVNNHQAAIDNENIA